MIKIDFQEPDTDNWKAWRVECETEQLSHNEAIQRGDKSDVNDRVYKGTKYNIKSDVYMNLDLEGPFYGKCAYCESLIVSDQDGDMEHFRPKKAVSDENFNPIRVEIDGEVKDHLGYYWLCYKHNNLLPSCILCNQKRGSGDDSTGKGTRFPVRGQYAKRPGEEVNEEPLLINPIFEDPEDHLELDETGIFRAKNDSEKGNVCINIFGLNNRKALIKARMDRYKSTKNKISILLMELSQGTSQNIECIKEVLEGRVPYSAAARAAIRDSRSKLKPFLDLQEESN